MEINNDDEDEEKMKKNIGACRMIGFGTSHILISTLIYTKHINCEQDI